MIFFTKFIYLQKIEAENPTMTKKIVTFYNKFLDF